jgi:hypothetical protein
MKVKENNMERKCIFCETPIDIKKHGLTKFCNAHCRNKFYYQNKPLSTIADQESTLQKNENLTNETSKAKVIGNTGQPNLPVHAATRDNDSFIYSLIEAKFDAKTECNLYKLKCEQLEKEKQILEKELFDANSEIDLLEVKEDDGPFSFLSGLPENVIAGISKAAFENPHMRDLFSSFVTTKK